MGKKIQWTPEELSELQGKIDYEGGLIEYVCGYGGDMPAQVADEVKAVKASVRELEDSFEALLNENDVEPL